MEKLLQQLPLTRGKMVNGFDLSKVDRLPPKEREMALRRQKVLGPAYRLFYSQPIEIVRGQGVHLFDAAGNEYLDAYNNVASLGHCHPRVVDAVNSQMQRLCTHTRYLNENVLAYAEDLISTFEPDISQVMFTCTGSEANDLALRIAKHHTGHEGVIITSEAYHGNSDQTAGISPSLGDHSPLGTWVRRVPRPDSYRMDHGSIAAWFEREVAQQIADLQRHGQGVAAVIFDSLFSSDGIYSHPTSLLEPVARLVRKAGGLFIADEVQSGFGRSGDALWGYQRHGLVPDMVTMGKPMGNGLPIAGVAFAPHVIAEFGQDVRYFNTFGGNNVSIAAAQATLDVIRDDHLISNAAVIGETIREGVRGLQSRFDCIGDVRGTGMYIGVEIVADKLRKVPDGDRALAIVNELRERRVLISATGPDSNVLKIRPPLIFGSSDADRLLTELEFVLASTRTA